MRGSHFGETCAFDGEGDLWFTGQGGYVGKVASRPARSRPRPRRVWSYRKGDIWVSDWGRNAALSFDAGREKFERYALPRESGNVRQILGRPGEVWLPESGTEHISVIRTA